MPRKPDKQFQAWLARHRDRHLCECGCGQIVQPDRHRYSRGAKHWFLFGHQMRGCNHPGYKGGRIHAKGYVWVLSHEHPRRSPRNYVKRCWLVLEEHLGRYLQADEMVHHKNGVKTDDRLENLEIVSRRAHCEKHFRGAVSPNRRHDIDFDRDIRPLLDAGLGHKGVARALYCSAHLVANRARLAGYAPPGGTNAKRTRRPARAVGRR